MLADAIIIVPVLLFSVIIHENAHGYVALLLGDPTAARAGRLTLNPLPHIDPFMTILLPLMLILSHSGVIFGGARPVPINPYHFKKIRRDSALVGLAGPASNALLAVAALLLIFVLDALGASSNPATITGALYRVLSYAFMINLVLGWFNLLPLPPLDGSRVLAYFLPRAAAMRYAQLDRYGLLLLFAFIFLDGITLWMKPLFWALNTLGIY
jgi:Zn-dependent protease